MKPRQLSALMYAEMLALGKRIFNEHADELEVTDLREGRGLVWDQLCSMFTGRYAKKDE